MAKLAFVIPVYNKNHILGKCLRSIASQSLKDIEVVLVFDGPQAGANAIVEAELSGKGLPYQVIEIPHGGACRARNEGFKKTTAPYIVFWDADCIIEPEMGQVWVTAFEKDNKIGFVYGGYRFLNEEGAIPSEPFDPWRLEVENYISSCFPMRREVFPGWDESLKSLQDWDMWLTIVRKGVTGKFIRGYAFSTEYPDPKSISGEGCRDDVWLSRVEPVRKKHNLPDNRICVSAMMDRLDGIHLAKNIGADYKDMPEFKPHKYDTIIKVGFYSSIADIEGNALSNPKVANKYLFWTPASVTEMYKKSSFEAVLKYRTLLNRSTQQFVECKKAYTLMRDAGFDVEICPMPMVCNGVLNMPEKPRFLVDIEGDYSEIISSVEKSIPDIELVMSGPNVKISDFSGLIHFYSDRTLSNGIKRALLAGRHIISNVQSEFCGYIDDTKSEDRIVIAIVKRIRDLAFAGDNADAALWWKKKLDPVKFRSMINERNGHLCNPVV